MGRKEECTLAFQSFAQTVTFESTAVCCLPPLVHTIDFNPVSLASLLTLRFTVLFFVKGTFCDEGWIMERGTGSKDERDVKRNEMKIGLGQKEECTLAFQSFAQTVTFESTAVCCLPPLVAVDVGLWRAVFGRSASDDCEAVDGGEE
ncbi:hypothetical protein LSTR_LSTR002657 [Laodelphax striatellus]|uniref:Uncharacterized protein n=1 Tax=Laodelphax striatellus TaxID=195883 RepID=A0A482X556_LAOST|nr:hypothetical protein LSTR_LSTR002657 [Laodelphax striatellus]